MNKTALILTLAATMIFSGCAGGDAANSTTTGDTSKDSEASTQLETPGPLDGLLLNEYDGLEITAAVLPRKAILPGSVVPVTIVIKNNGEKTISYTQGSGSFETPQALLVSFDDLQPVRPKDHLGVATRDFTAKQLKPGETVSFVANILAIQPNEKFDTYSNDLYNSEELYIADLEWSELNKRYPDLVAVESGSYSGTVSLPYSIVEDPQNVLLGEPTGYAQAKIDISVTT